MDVAALTLCAGTVVLFVQTIFQNLSDFATDDFVVLEMQKEDTTLWKNADMLVSTAALYDMRLNCTLIHYSDDLQWWVKPRSTIWFSQFLLHEYDRGRWLQHFRMPKETVLNLCRRLAPRIKKQDTRYRYAIPVEIRVTATLYKLAHGATVLTCSELFAIGRATVSQVIREVCEAICAEFGDLISWPRGPKMLAVMEEFRDMCDLPGVQGAIDCTHIHIGKPRGAYAEDYFYYKSGGHSLIAQAVVDSRKRFLDLFVGMPGSTNDSRTLRKSGLYGNVLQRRILDDATGVMHEGFSPYLIGDKGYPLLNWLMVPHKLDGQPLTVSQKLYNKRLSRGRAVVENAFGIMKGTWRELLRRSELHINIMPDVVYTCALLHNLILNDRNVDIDEVLSAIRLEATTFGPPHPRPAYNQAIHPRLHGEHGAMQKRQNLEAYLVGLPIIE